MRNILLAIALSGCTANAVKLPESTTKDSSAFAHSELPDPCLVPCLEATRHLLPPGSKIPCVDASKCQYDICAPEGSDPWVCE